MTLFTIILFFQGDAESIILAMEENAVQNPNKVFDVKLALEEKDYVAVHPMLDRAQRTSEQQLFTFSASKGTGLWSFGI
jgi:hypothetical protein